MYDSHEMAAQNEVAVVSEMGSTAAVRISKETPLRIDIPNPEYLGGPSWTLVFKPVERNARDSG